MSLPPSITESRLATFEAFRSAAPGPERRRLALAVVEKDLGFLIRQLEDYRVQNEPARESFVSLVVEGLRELARLLETASGQTPSRAAPLDFDLPLRRDPAEPPLGLDDTAKESPS